jgi:hypothetical protein
LFHIQDDARNNGGFFFGRDEKREGMLFLLLSHFVVVGLIFLCVSERIKACFH